MKQSVNPFLDNAWMPNYAAMTPELCEQALRETLPKAERALSFVEKQLDISWQGLVLAPMQALRAPFSVWGILTHLTSVVQNDAWRKVEETWQPAIIELGQKAAQSRRIY